MTNESKTEKIKNVNPQPIIEKKNRGGGRGKRKTEEKEEKQNS